MANTPYAPNLTRMWWTGTDADLDAHIELYDGLIDQSYALNSLFLGMNLSNIVSVEGKTNVYRYDRLGGASVKGRKSGEALDSQRAVNEKATIVVDTTSYVRHPFDWQDEWTAPSIVRNVSREQGYAMAHHYDECHITQLIKAGNWQAPASLKATGNFHDGVRTELTGFAAATDQEAKADMIFQAHKDAIATLVRRRANLSNLVTLISPEWYSILLDHKKLTQTLFQGNQDINNLIQRRINILNNTPIIETDRIDNKVITNSFMGSRFNRNATEAKAGMIVFDPTVTLITVEAQPLQTRLLSVDKDLTNLLDTYQMFTADVRRGDSTVVIASD